MNHIEINGNSGTYFIYPQLKHTIADDELQAGKTFTGFRHPDGKRFFIRHLLQSRDFTEIHAWLMHNESMIPGDGKHFAGSVELIKQLDHLFLVREFAEGMTLKEMLRERSFRSAGKLKTVLHIMLRLLDNLKSLHSQNIIHCNLRPSCIYIPLRGKEILFEKSMLTDFSLARTELSVQKIFKLPVTYLYHSPEVILSEHDLICPSSDLYSLGIILYQMLKGHHPFRVQHPGVVGDMHLMSPISNLHGIHPLIQSIILKSTARKLFSKPPEQTDKSEIRSLLSEGITMRYANATEMSTDIEKVLNELETGKPGRARKRPESKAIYSHPVVLFDDMCILCTRSLQYLIRHDKKHVLRYAGLSNFTASVPGLKLTDAGNTKSIILTDNQKIYTKSEAFVRIMYYLGGWHILLTSLWIIPRFIRNFAYNIIAGNRYRWWGKRNECYIPPLYERFLFTDFTTKDRDEHMESGF